MNHDFHLGKVLNISVRIGWTIEDVLPEGAVLDLGRRVLHETLARTDAIAFPHSGVRRLLSQIRGREYLTPVRSGRGARVGNDPAALRGYHCRSVRQRARPGCRRGAPLLLTLEEGEVT